MSRAYEHAERFCEMVKSPNLVSYLHLDQNCTADEAQKALEQRKVYLESVQDLPEYRKEAAYFIRHLTSFSTVLQDPDEYVKKIARRKVFKHLPEFKNSVYDLLESGTLTTEGVAYLRRLALDLGITMDVFEETLDQICEEKSVTRPIDGGISFAAPVGDFESDNPYKVLGASRHATLDSLRESYEVNLAAARNLGDPVDSLQAISSVEAAWKTVSNSEMREALDNEILSSATSTAPTAPIRTVRKLEPRKKKAPSPRKQDPLRLRPRRILTSRSSGNVPLGTKRAESIEVKVLEAGRIKVITKPISLKLVITKTDQKPLFARVSTDKGWLVAEKSDLDESATTQTLSVTVNPAEIFQSRVTGRVVLQLETGERISTPIDVEKLSWWSPMANIPAFIGTVALVGVGLFLLGNMFIKDGHAGGLRIIVDPSSEAVLINGHVVGKGSYVPVPNPPLGTVRLDVVQSNFVTYRTNIELEEGEIKDAIVRLKLHNPMTFRPSASMTRDKTIDAEDIRNRLPIEEMNDCLNFKSIPDVDQSPVVVIYLGDDGKSNGVEIEGPIAGDSVVKDCLTRQAATVSYNPLTNGDYAMIAVYLDDK